MQHPGHVALTVSAQTLCAHRTSSLLSSRTQHFDHTHGLSRSTITAAAALTSCAREGIKLIAKQGDMWSFWRFLQSGVQACLV